MITNGIAVHVTDVSIDWTTMKGILSNTLGAFLNYIDLGTSYYLWITLKSNRFYLPSLLKNTTDATDFETNYKANCNVPEAAEVRIRTCAYGRKQHSRYISFTTASQNTYTNNNALGVDWGDVTYIMLDATNAITTTNANAVQTWIDWMPNYSYEVRGGQVFVPTTLTGDVDAWELHVIGAPDIPSSYGGNVPFVSNPHLKWCLGGVVDEDCSLDPATVTYYPGMPANKIRFIIKHPAGEQVGFQIRLQIFK